MINKVPSLHIEHVDFSLGDIVAIPNHDQPFVGEMLVEEAKQDGDYYEWQYSTASISKSPVKGKVIRVTLAKVVLTDG